VGVVLDPDFGVEFGLGGREFPSDTVIVAAANAVAFGGVGGVAIRVAVTDAASAVVDGDQGCHSCGPPFPLEFAGSGIGPGGSVS
jgi:hypothetical protein